MCFMALKFKICWTFQSGTTTGLNILNLTCVLFLICKQEAKYQPFLVDSSLNGLRTPSEGINQRNLKIRADVADKICFGRKYLKICDCDKVIYTKYSKHWLYTVAHTIECVCSRMNNSWFNPWFLFYFLSLCSAPYIEWCMC